jgi:hypothetical protein
LDKAFEWLETAYVERDTGLSYPQQVDPFLLDIHNDPRWQPPLVKMGLVY